MPKRGYHHGNLREALVDATLDLISEKGPTGFTMAEIAKAAGVSPAAPYRHFKGREEIIEAIALQGFTIFGDLMVHAKEKQRTPRAKLEALGRAYLAFARKFPGNYIAMFESGVSINASPELASAANKGLDELIYAAQELTAHLPEEDRPPASMISQHIWAMSHGIVELFARGKPGARSAFDPEDLLESGIAVYLRGLGVPLK